MEPRYEIPLTDNQLKQLGRLGAIWAQLDYFMVMAIAALTGAEMADGFILLDKVYTGQKRSILVKLASRIDNPEIAKSAKEFLSHSDFVLGKRNHLMHGIWGIYVEPTHKIEEPACRQSLRT